MDIPHLVAAFRGEDRRTLVEVHYALPLGLVSRARDRQDDSLAIEVGMTVHDPAWRRIGFFRGTKRLPSQTDRAALVFDRIQMDVLPDSYHVALHGRSLQTPLLGAYRFSYRAPSFNGPGLMMSDLLPADAVIELEDAQPLGRDDLYVRVNPVGRFSVQEPVFVYFEIYDLAVSSEGRTRYRLTYTLTPKERGGLRGLLQQDEGAIALTAMVQEGVVRSPVEYVAIDVTDVPPGPYVLTVTVRDEHTGATVESGRPLEVRED